MLKFKMHASLVKAFAVVLFVASCSCDEYINERVKRELAEHHRMMHDVEHFQGVYNRQPEENVRAIRSPVENEDQNEQEMPTNVMNYFPYETVDALGMNHVG